MNKIFYSQMSYRDTDVVPNLIQKKLNNLKIIDIGGTMNGWSHNFVDYMVDINEPDDKSINIFVGNICETEVWDKIINYVKLNGKFDYSICSHTLEDISNPLFVTKKIEEISNSGIIMVPSKYYEMCRHEGNYRGWIHHRYIFNIENDKLVGYPKLNFLDYISEYDNLCDKSTHDNYQIVYEWENKINFKIINDEYMGPDVNSVINYYKSLFD